MQQHYHVIYEGQIGKLKSDLTPRLEWMKGELEKAKRETLSVSITASSGQLDAGEFWHEGEFDLKVVFKNISKTRSPEIDNISITASNGWKLYAGGKECVSEKGEEGVKKFFVPVPNPRLAPGALSQLDVTFKKTFWSKWTGEEKKGVYKAKGPLILEVATAEGIIPFGFDLDVQFDEVPF
ncbi:hypothetical protein [Pseudophaeobacter sp.]|uniref:hypothetical protein n=1 Tax=Pseudophaeobacter sp. TaxID=1971739 RepID=UPI003297B9C6